MKLFSLSLPLLLSLSVFLGVVVLYFNFCSSWHWHNSPKFACVCVCVSVCRLIAQWAVKQASPSSFNLTFYALYCAALWQQVATWQLRFRFVSCHFTECPQWDFLIGIPINANAIFNFISIVTLATLLAVKAKGNSLRNADLKNSC